MHIILTNSKDCEYNISYISTAIKWAIRNEIRCRNKWYAFKQRKNNQKALLDSSEDISNINILQIREAIYGTILSIDEIAESDNPTQIQIKDNSFTPEEVLEFRELDQAIHKLAFTKLPCRERIVLKHIFSKIRK